MDGRTQGLTDEERAELEELRAERAAREEAERAAAERAELERLRAERDARKAKDAATLRQSEAEARRTSEIAAARARGRAIMEPGDDLSMPLGQKIVLIAVALIVAGIIAAIMFAPK